MRHAALILGPTLLLSVQLSGQNLPARKALVGTIQSHPDCYRKLTSTDRLTAYNITIPPHGSTAVKQHPYDYLLVSLTQVELQATGGSGTSYPVRLEQEEMQVMKGGWAHRLTNDSDNPARLIEIDVQPNIAPERASCGLAASPCTDGQFGKTKEGSYATSTLFETPKVRLMKIELGTRGVFERHAHTGSEMLIPLTRVHLIDGSQSDIEKDVGEVQAYPTRTTHELKNIGSETARFLELEAK